MLNYFWSTRYTKEQILDMILEVETDRNKLRSINEKLNTTFAQDLRLLLLKKYL